MNIYVDFDDCLCETGRSFSVLASELFGINVPYEEMRYFNLQHAFGLTEEQYRLLLVKGHEPDRILSGHERMAPRRPQCVGDHRPSRQLL